MKYDLNEYLDAINDVWIPKKPDSMGEPMNISITNNLYMWIDLIKIDQEGNRIRSPKEQAIMIIGPGKIYNLENINPGDGFRLNCRETGSFVGTLTIKESVDNYSIDVTFLTDPNKIGNPPKPEKGKIIPGDSNRVCVGNGFPTADIFIIRDQYWKLSDESHVLAPKEKRTISFTTQSGIQETSTSQKTLSESLNVAVAGGWGPIQTSISAALNKTTSTTQSVVISSNTTKYESYEKTNDSDKTKLYLGWQMMDYITIVDSELEPKCLGVIVLALQPSIFMEYDLDEFLIDAK